MRKNVFKGRVLSLSLYTLSINKRKVTREVIEHPGAAAILAIEDGKILLVRQHRFPHGVLLSLARFKRILKLDLASRTAVVQPGVRNLAISDAAAPDRKSTRLNSSHH